MSKSIKMKDSTYIDTTGITHDRESLHTMIDNGLLRSKRIIFNRDGQGASGDVSYTGVGFKPTSIVALMVVQGTAYCSEGIADSTKDSLCKYQIQSGISYLGGNLIMYSDQVSFVQSAVVKTYDNDGFTLTWTKIATPTANTMVCYLICYK